MPETYSQPTFGQQTFIDNSASGSLSGRDDFGTMDATAFYHTDDRDYSNNTMDALHISSPDAFSAGQQFGFGSHRTGVSLPGFTPQTISTMNGHMSHQFDHEHAIQPGLDALDGFSPLAPSPYTVNPYRTPYPDSNATSTSSATSPDPASATLMNDPVIVEADEDKRKRNQAASARFRQKKKQREQQLMESTREMQDRTKKLEQENDGLKKENLFLKKLLVEKVDHMSEDDLHMLRKVADGVLDGTAVKKKGK